MAYGEHKYKVSVQWTGNRGSGTSGYRDYGRDHVITAGSKPAIPGSSDAAFLGDAKPLESGGSAGRLGLRVSQALVSASLRGCRHRGARLSRRRRRHDARQCAQQGRFSQIVLRPHVVIRAGGDVEQAAHLHHVAHEKCYIANSVNFPILCEPVIETDAR